MTISTPKRRTALIVADLRKHGKDDPALRREAADEIERLEKALVVLGKAAWAAVGVDIVEIGVENS